MRIVRLLSFILSLSCICSFCFAGVSYPHVFPKLVSSGEDVMMLVFIRANNAATSSCDLSKQYNFSYEYNYSSEHKKGVLTEQSYIYPDPNNKLKLYSANIAAHNNSNLSIIIECEDLSEPDTHHKEIKTYKVMTGDLQFSYEEDEFVFKNKPNDTIVLYPYDIIQKNGKNISEEEIQTYGINYSLYNLYTENVIERKVFQKQLDLHKSSHNNLFTCEANYPIGYIVFEGDNGAVLGGKYFPYYVIPFSFSLVETSKANIKGDTAMLNIDYCTYYGSFPDNLSVEVVKPDGKKDSFFLLKADNYQNSYLLNQIGLYTISATAHSNTGYSYTSIIQINIQDYKTVSIITDKETYYKGDIIYLNATLLENTNAVSSHGISLKVTSDKGVYYNTTDAKKINNIWTFSIPLSFEPDSFVQHEIFVYMKDDDEVTWTGKKRISLYENVSLNFTLSPSSMDVEFTGELIKKNIIFVNTGSANISRILINASSLEDAVSFDFSYFSLNASQSKNITIYMVPEDPSKEKIEGDVFFTAGNISRKISISIDINVSYSAELETNKYDVVALVGKKATIVLKLKNTGIISLDDIKFQFSGGLTDYFVNSSIPDSIIIGDEGTLLFDFFNFDEEKTISGNIEIDSNGVKNIAEVTISVMGDIVNEINDIKDKKDELVSRLENLKSTNEKDGLMDVFYELQTDISDLNSDYSNGKYLDAKEKIVLIDDKIYSLERSISNIEDMEDSVSGDCGDGICNMDEDENICSEDCFEEGGAIDKPLPKKTTGIIVVGVLIAVIVVVIVATSIVPDDYKEEEGDESNIDYDMEE